MSQFAQGNEELATLLDQRVAPAVNTAQQAVKDMTPLKGKNALVVDNALATRRALQDQLSQLGARAVVFAGSVGEVEQHFQTREFALIVCEYQLEGDRNGQQLLEELRVRKQLPYSTAFMMVTGERSYSNVIAVAEFEPDDYLIKPFTASIMAERVVRIFNRKNRLEKAYKAMFEERYSDVPALCEELWTQYPVYRQPLERLRVEAYMRNQQYEEAEKILQNGLAMELKPWMQLLLAKVHVEKKRFDEASSLLGTVVRTNPEYLAASDLHADVLWELNRPDEALEVLERMGAKAQSSTSRLRKLADLSIRLGDNSRSKNYLSKVIDRSRNTSLSQLGDYLQLSRIFVQEGRPDEAERLTAKLRGALQSSDLDLARSVMGIQREIAEGNIMKAQQRIGTFYAENGELIDTLDTELQASLLEMCFSTKDSRHGYELARTLSKRKPGKAILDRIRLAIEKFNKESK